MPFRAFVWCMIVSSFLAWAGWVYVLSTVDPDESGFLGFTLFYLTLFIALLGTLAVLGLALRVRSAKQRPVLSREVKIAFRHAVMLSSVSVLTLILSAQGLLFWWNFFGLLILVIVIEYGFLLVHESRRA